MEEYDIVIVGAGPVGLLLATCLARWGYKIKHIDNRAQPTRTGRADGIQPRSLDLLKNMGLKTAVMSHKPARVYEVAFWDPSDKENRIKRTGTWAACPDFIDARYPFTTLLHQGLIERVFIDDMKLHGATVQRPWTIEDFEVDKSGSSSHPITVHLMSADAQGEKETVKAKYLFSGEGGRSTIRQKLGIEMQYKDPISYVWGVMDGVVKTDFPDIKMKCTIHSDAGSIMVIPREANMVRLYVQLASSSDSDFNPRKAASAEDVQERAKKIFRPYSIEWEHLEWYSVYPIGQGIAAKYTLDERVFMGGDACHTHSPKAGQGMNTAFLDAQNLAWKIHAVESGFSERSTLKTYQFERRFVAENLLDFDNRYAKLFSTQHPAETASNATGGKGKEENDFIRTFKESCEFTSGYGVAYQPDTFNWSDQHAVQSDLFLSYPKQTKLRTGRIMINSNVRRVVDANVVHLEQEIPMNGAFRVFVFAGAKNDAQQKKLADFSDAASKSNSFLTRFLHPDLSAITHHEHTVPHSRFFSFCTIIAAKRSDIEVSELPPLLARYRAHVYADDVPDLRALDAKASSHAKMGFDEEQGGVVVVRPDGYVGCVLKLEGGASVDVLNRYFASFCKEGTVDQSLESALSKRKANGLTNGVH